MNGLENFAVMNQVAATTVALETPLHHAELQALAQQSAAADAGVTLNERRLTGQLVLRVRGDLDVASTAIESVVGLGLPDRLRFSGNPCSYAERSMAWLSPDEWRLCCPADEAFALENALRDKLAPLAGVSIAVVNNTGGFTLLDVAGKNATELLQKSTGYDIRNAHFPVGKVVGTSFAKSTVSILRTSEHSWQLWVRRSFADYIWLWLQQAAAEYGLRILED